MNIDSIKNYWKHCKVELLTYSLKQVEKPRVTKDTAFFFTTCGFPDSVAPTLSFSEVGHQFSSPNEVFGISEEGLDNYLMFGCNGSGDPICIDLTKANEVVYLNHDREFQRVFINATVIQFAASLTVFQTFLYSIILPERNDFLRRKFTEQEFENLKNELIDIDEKSLAEDVFWTYELDYLLWERDNESV